MEKKWFYFENYVYINCIAPNKVLLYNTLNSDILTYQIDTIYDFVKMVKQSENNNIVEIDLQSLKFEDEKLYDFIINVRNHYMGDLLPALENKQKPLLFQSNPKILNEGHTYFDFGENILFNLTEVSFYITNKCSAGCFSCSQYNKQFLCCGKFGENNELPLNTIVHTLEELKESSLCKINVLGGNIFTYMNFCLLVESLNKFPIEKVYKVNIKQTKDHIADLQMILKYDNNRVELICTDLNEVEELQNIVKKMGTERTIVNIVVQSDSDLCKISELSLENVVITPFYNGENLDFFKNEVFVTIDDLKYLSLDYKSIKRNFLLNSNFFGSLFCLPDGSVYANLNSERLGYLYNSSMSSIILKELQVGNSWLLLRRNIKPCQNCLYSCLCPSVSNYEKVIGHNDLCTIANS